MVVLPALVWWRGTTRRRSSSKPSCHAEDPSHAQHGAPQAWDGAEEQTGWCPFLFASDPYADAREKGGTRHEALPARSISIGSASCGSGASRVRGRGASSQVVDGQGAFGPKGQTSLTKTAPPTHAAQAQVAAQAKFSSAGPPTTPRPTMKHPWAAPFSSAGPTCA